MPPALSDVKPVASSCRDIKTRWWTPQKRMFGAGPWARPAGWRAHRLCGHRATRTVALCRAATNPPRVKGHQVVYVDARGRAASWRGSRHLRRDGWPAALILCWAPLKVEHNPSHRTTGHLENVCVTVRCGTSSLGGNRELKSRARVVCRPCPREVSILALKMSWKVCPP